MSNIFVRRAETAVPRSARADMIIDLLDDRRKSNVDHDLGKIVGRVGMPSPRAQELLILAASVFIADKVLLRRDSPDAWTRDMAISTPSASPTAWDAGREPLRKALRFLSGDEWSLEWRAESVPMNWSAEKGKQDADAVCLFSGGVDSLVGAINTLEREPRTKVVLVGWYDQTQGGRQRREELAAELAKVYGSNRVSLVPLWLAPAQPRAEQQHPFHIEEFEATSRSRSLLYLSLGIAAASALGTAARVIAPENGFIAINPPMTPARLGSLSTRTMHPYFLSQLSAALQAAGIAQSISNPLSQDTKGEVMSGCANQRLLQRLFPRTISCARSGRKESGRNQDSCGYCYPCIVRRSAAATVGWDDAREYRRDVLRDAELFAPTSIRGADARAVFAGLRELSAPRVIATGPLPYGDVVKYIRLVERGAEELRAFFRSARAGIRRIAML